MTIVLNDAADTTYFRFHCEVQTLVIERLKNISGGHVPLKSGDFFREQSPHVFCFGFSEPPDPVEITTDRYEVR